MEKTVSQSLLHMFSLPLLEYSNSKFSNVITKTKITSVCIVSPKELFIRSYLISSLKAQFGPLKAHFDSLQKELLAMK